MVADVEQPVDAPPRWVRVVDRVAFWTCVALALAGSKTLYHRLYDLSWRATEHARYKR